MMHQVISRLTLKFMFFAGLLFVSTSFYQCQAQHFTDLAEPEAPLPQPPVQASASPILPGLPEPIKGRGRLSVAIESFAGANPRRISRMADRVEIWLGDHRIASLNYTDPEVVREKNRRIFLFPEISLGNGYYFITARLYSHATLYGRDKWHGETFQIGIHPDKISRVYKKVAFFHF